MSNHISRYHFVVPFSLKFSDQYVSFEKYECLFYALASRPLSKRGRYIANHFKIMAFDCES